MPSASSARRRNSAAISGASEVNYHANYGHDHYLREWEAELGLPWERTDLWISLSPYFKATKVKTPTLILCGEQDAIAPAAEMQGIAEAIPDAKFVSIAGAGHMAPLEKPAEVNAAIRSFLK